MFLSEEVITRKIHERAPRYDKERYVAYGLCSVKEAGAAKAFVPKEYGFGFGTCIKEDCARTNTS